MAKNFSLIGEKSVLSRLLGRDMKKNASSTPKTLEEEREALASQAKAIAEKSPLDPRAYNARESGPIKHQAKYETSNKDAIVRSASRELNDFISDKVGRGGFVIEEAEFKKISSHKSLSDNNSEEIDKAVIAFKIDFTTGTKPKSCFAAVDFDRTDKDQSLTVKSFFVDCVDSKRKVAASKEGIEAYLTSAPSDYTFERKLAYFDVSNPENQTWVKLNVKSVSKAKAMLEKAGFEIQSRVLGRENNLTGPVYELVLTPEKYAQAKTVIASEFVEVDENLRDDEKFENAHGNEPDAKTDDPKNWQDRSLEKNAPKYMKPTDASQPKENEPTKDTPATTWDTRSLEKNETTPLGKFTPADPNKVKQDEAFEEKNGNTPMESDPTQWQDRSLEQNKSTPPGAKTLMKYERKKGQLLEQVESSPESVLTPPPVAPNEIPVNPAPIDMVGPETMAPDMGMEVPVSPVDSIIEMLNSTELSYEEIEKVEEALENKEKQVVETEETDLPGEDKPAPKTEDKGEKKEEPKEEKKEEKSEDKKEDKPKEEKSEEKKEASKKVMATTKKLANFQCVCGTYLSTPSCDCSAPRFTSLGQLTDSDVGNLASPAPDFKKNNATKDEMDGLDHGKTAADGSKPKVTPSTEVKGQAGGTGKPMSGKNPPVPNEQELSTKQEPMGGMKHGDSSNSGTSTKPPHGKGKGIMDGINETNMVDMNALEKGKTPMDGMDHGKTNDGPAKVVPSKEVPSLKASLTPADKNFKKVFRVSAAKKVEALKTEVINQWDRGTITTDEAAIRLASIEKTAQEGLGQEEVKPEANKYFLDENMGKDFLEYKDKNWFNRSREKNPDPSQKPLNIAQPSVNQPTKDTAPTTWDTRSLEKDPDDSTKKLDIPKTSEEVKPRQDEAFEKAHGNEPDNKDNDPTEWQNRSLEKRTKFPNDDKLMFTE